MTNWEYDYSELYSQTNTPAVGTPPTPTPEQEPAQYAWQPQQPTPPKKPTAGRNILLGTVAILLCGSVGFGGGLLGSWVSSNNMNTTAISSSKEPALPSAAPTIAVDGESLTVAEIAAITAPSVVQVATEGMQTSSIYGQYVTSGAGSGVIISEDGYIITNAHVISGAQQVSIKLNNDKTYEAKIVGSDARTDIAVLKIEETGLTPVSIGDSDALVVGEFTMAVGNPLGTLGGTVTDGIISALSRQITVSGEAMTLLQTNTAISPGNSGGGLFNARGQLVGIVNAKSVEANTEGIGFAVPVNTAMNVANELIANGYVSGRPALGITALSITDYQTAMQYGVANLGVYVASVTEGGSAEKAGLKVNDLFVSIDDTAISSRADITTILGKYEVGDTVKVQVVREQHIITTNLVLMEQTAPVAQSSSTAQRPDNAKQGG